jgi:hypothetical protein
MEWLGLLQPRLKKQDNQLSIIADAGGPDEPRRYSPDGRERGDVQPWA